MTEERVGKESSTGNRATARIGKALAAAVSLPGRGVARLAGWLARSRRWRWALGFIVLVALLAAAWVSVAPWASYLRSGPQGLELDDGWLGWDWIDTGEGPSRAPAGDHAAMTPVDSSLIPVDPSRIPVDPVPAPQEPPPAEEELDGAVPAQSAVPAAVGSDGTALWEDREGVGGWEVQSVAGPLAPGEAARGSARGAAAGLQQPMDPRAEMRLPADGAVVREVGWYRHPTYGDWRFYPGVEIQLRPGTAVSPALAGRVVRVEDDARWALTVWVDHGSGWQTSYGYLREALVLPGQEVDQDSVLGISGVSPLGEPQIMFAVWKDGQPVDPARLMP